MVRQENIDKATAALRLFTLELTHLNAEEREKLQERIRAMGSGSLESLATVLVTKAVHGAIEKLNYKPH